jgi:hypothetical protein
MPLATTAITVERIPFESGSFNRGVNIEGRGQLTVRSDYSRLSTIVDEDTNVISLIRLVQDGTARGWFFARRTEEEIGDDEISRTIISGPGIERVMRWAQVEAFDYPAKPSVDRDWVWGDEEGTQGDSSFANAGFESSDGGSDFEDQTLQGWEAIPGGGDFDALDSGPSITSAEAQAGTYSLQFDPDLHHSGVRKAYALEDGGRYQFQIRLKSNTTAKRFTAGVLKGGGGTVHHTNGFVYNGIAMAELGNVARNPAADGTPGGSTDGTWQTIDLDVTFPAGRTSTTLYVQYDHHGGGDGPLAFLDSVTAAGPGLGLAPWRKSGTLTTFEQSTAQVDSGTYSAKILTSGQFEGIDQLVTGLVVGRTHTFTAKIYHAAGANRDFRLRILRGDGGTAIATNTVAVPTGTWTEISVSGVVDVADAVVEIHYADVAAAMDWWVDSTKFRGGMASDSWGGIFQDLMDDATVDHTAETPPLDRDVLGFLDYSSFTGTLDSSGNAWNPATVEYRANRGKKYSQVAADASNQGTEWEVKETATPGSFELNLYNPYDFDTFVGGVGQDLSSADFPVIMVGNGVVAGPTVTEPAGGNVMVVEGAGGVWDLVKDTTAIGNYDRRELYAGDQNLLGLSTVTETAQQLLDVQLKPPKPLKVVMRTFGDDTTGRVVPWRDFGVGDRVKVHIPPKYIQAVKRVVEITTDFRPDEATHTVEFETRTYTSDPVKGTIEAVRRLLDKFDRLEEPGVPGETTIVPFESRGASVPTVLVAASNARSEIQEIADFVCDGADDQEEIQAAVDLVASIVDGSGHGGGRIILSAGRFVFGASGVIHFDATDRISIQIQGMGINATEITSSTMNITNNGVFDFDSSGGHTQFSDFTIIIDGTRADSIFFSSSGTSVIERIHMQNRATTAISHVLAGGGSSQLGVVAVRDCLIGRTLLVNGSGIQVGGVDWVIDNCVFDGTGLNKACIEIDDGVENARITNCMARRGVDGPFVQRIGTGIDPRNLVITDNFIAGIIYDAIDLDDVFQCVIANNVFGAENSEKIDGVPIKLTQARQTVVANNIIFGTETDHAINLIGACDDVLLIGNIVSAGDDAFHVSTTATKVMLHNNHVVSATNDGLHVESGGDVTVHGNDFSGASTAINGTVIDLHGIGGAADELIEETQTFSYTGTLAVTTGTHRWTAAYDLTIVDARAVVNTQPTGATVIVDVNKNGTTIFTTQANRPTIAVSTNDSGLAVPDVTSYTAGDYIQVDIDQIGSTIAGADLTVMVRFRRV